MTLSDSEVKRISELGKSYEQAGLAFKDKKLRLTADGAKRLTDHNASVSSEKAGVEELKMGVDMAVLSMLYDVTDNGKTAVTVQEIEAELVQFAQFATETDDTKLAEFLYSVKDNLLKIIGGLSIVKDIEIVQ
jgi:hypothetical protein